MQLGMAWQLPVVVARLGEDLAAGEARLLAQVQTLFPSHVDALRDAPSRLFGPPMFPLGFA